MATTIFKPVVGVITRETERGIVILDAESGQCYEGNRTAATVWSRLLDGEDLETISQAIAEQCNAPVAVVLQDVTRLVLELRDRHLVDGGS